MSSSIMSRELALVVVGLCLPLQSSLTCTLTQAEIRKHMGTLSSEVHQLNSHVKSAYINKHYNNILFESFKWQGVIRVY